MLVKRGEACDAASSRASKAARARVRVEAARVLQLGLLVKPREGSIDWVAQYDDQSPSRAQCTVENWRAAATAQERGCEVARQRATGARGGSDRDVTQVLAHGALTAVLCACGGHRKVFLHGGQGERRVLLQPAVE